MVEVRHSVCALDCPDCCSVLVTIEDGLGTKLRGDSSHPITRGFLCAKVAQYLEREYSPNRLLLSAASHRIERLGSEAALPYSYAGTMGLLNNRGMDRRFFHRFGASRLDHG